VDLRTNSDYFPTQHQLVGFYDRSRPFLPQYGLGPESDSCMYVLKGNFGVEENNRSLFWNSHISHKYSVWA